MKFNKHIYIIYLYHIFILYRRLGNKIYKFLKIEIIIPLVIISMGVRRSTWELFRDQLYLDSLEPKFDVLVHIQNPHSLLLRDSFSISKSDEGYLSQRNLG